MRITMLTIGSTGDVRPYILLGKELSSRGHQITIAAFGSFEEMVTDAGLGFFALSGDAGNMINTIMRPDTNALSYLPRITSRLNAVIPDLLKDMEKSCENAEALICNFFGSVYYSIAEKYNIPCVQTQFFPMDPTGAVPISSIRNQRLGSRINLVSYKIGYLLIGLVEKHFLAEWRQKSGVSRRKPLTHPDYSVNNHTVPVVYALSPFVFARPSEWSSHIYMSGFWFDESPCSWSPDPDLLRFVEQNDSPVYIGFGSMNGGDMNKIITTVLRSVRAAGLRAVISVGWSGRRFVSGKRVFFTGYVPHDWLFPRVRAVVHHGGAGTTAAGLRYGKPTLIIPFAGDQPFWGHRVHELGCGPKPIRCDSLTVQKLTKALSDLISQKNTRKTVSASWLCLRMNMVL